MHILHCARNKKLLEPPKMSQSQRLPDVGVLPFWVSLEMGRALGKVHGVYE